jgi:hypothetical protein
MAAVTFEDSSRLKRIGERAFAGCHLSSITIPASTEDRLGIKTFRYCGIDCPLMEIRLQPGNQNFMIHRKMLLTSDETELVRYFGRDLEVIVPRSVEVLQQSCFHSSNPLEEAVVQGGSKLRKIAAYALCDCASLISIALPALVEAIEEFAFKNCDGLKSCWMQEHAILARIEREAFAECRSLQSFSVPQKVEEIGPKCFCNCVRLSGLKFCRGESLKKIVGV